MRRTRRELKAEIRRWKSIALICAGAFDKKDAELKRFDICPLCSEYVGFTHDGHLVYHRTETEQ